MNCRKCRAAKKCLSRVHFAVLSSVTHSLTHSLTHLNTSRIRTHFFSITSFTYALRISLETRHPLVRPRGHGGRMGLFSTRSEFPLRREGVSEGTTSYSYEAHRHGHYRHCQLRTALLHVMASSAAQFCHINALDLIVRAHQFTMSGFQYRFPSRSTLTGRTGLT